MLTPDSSARRSAAAVDGFWLIEVFTSKLAALSPGFWLRRVFNDQSRICWFLAVRICWP